MGREWPKTTDSRWKSATRDEQILALARSQHHLLTTGQMLEAGFSDGAVRHRLAARRLFSVHAGVHSISPPPLSGEARLMAAVLACGEGSVVRGPGTLWLYGLRRNPPDVVAITSARGSGRKRRGIRVHRQRLVPADLTRRRGIPTTTPTRAIFDVAATWPPRALEELILLASSKGLLNDARLGHLCDLGLPGSRSLKRLIGSEIPFVRSTAEIAYLRISDSLGIERPLVNATIEALGRHYEVDFHWPQLRLIVEVDGYAFHGSRSQANRDRDREQILSMAGWSVHRFTRDQIVDDPGEVGRRTLAIYRRELARVAENHR